MQTVYNFSAGPAMLPHDVLLQAQRELIDWQGLGTSVMEISHRSKAFIAVAEKAEADLRSLLHIPNNYKVLFMHGGGRGQFAAVPMNLAAPNSLTQHLVTGQWSIAAEQEARKYANTEIVASSVQTNGQWSVPHQNKWQVNPNAAYLHYCSNETVEGIEINWLPETGLVPIVADMSSNILSKPIDVSKFGVIYAGAQKNIGPSGLSIVIVRDDLLEQASPFTPDILNYKIQAAKGSMYNTPPTFAWYLAGLVFEWLIQQGGLSVIEQKNQEKASLLYDFIDESSLFNNHVSEENRSAMNVTFSLADSALEAPFLTQSHEQGLHALKGHRSVGGMRASIYNAMPLAGVQRLVEFMREFERNSG